MLKLICGPSSSGKTAALTEAIRRDIANGKRCFLLVPEQQAYISERDLPSVLPQNAGLFFEVVHFSGLAEAVFRSFGGVTQGVIDSGLRNLLMWNTLRTLAPLLNQYGKSAKNDPTLTALMLQTVSELHLNGITSEQLEEVSRQLPPESSLCKKLSDLALIDAAFSEEIRSLFGFDPSDKLLRLAEVLHEKKYFTGAHLYIDSFTSFTAQEYAVLREILKQAESVTVSLCMQAGGTELPHFESVAETAKRLSKLASQVGVPLVKEALTAPAIHKPKTLLILERDLWRFDLSREARELPPPQEQDVLRLLTCSNLYEESEAVALQIMELVQNGMHYGDIAVVVRDTETYRGVLDAALERFHIPYFLSESSDLAAKPISRLILSALRVISRHYRTEDVITLIKSGLTGVSFADAAMFEEYCETWHISGNRFLDEVWSMNPDGLTTEHSERSKEILLAANRVRKAVVEPLEAFSAELRRSPRLSDRCRAVYHYLSALRVSEQLSARAKAELAAGDRRQAGETVRLYRFITDTLTSLCKWLPEAELTVEELISAFSLLFSGTSFSSVPNLHDCVMIGSAATLRVENVKASFLLGLCEGEFPCALQENGILTEGDKEDLEAFGILLDSRASMRSSEELLYVYRAMTKPTERLFLSTVAMQPDGSARTPSLAFSRVCFLLNRLPEAFDAEAVRAAIGEEPDPGHDIHFSLPPAPAGTTLRLSQSKLRTFMLCPYSYYSIYQLKLREKKDSRPSYADDGLFLHYVFEHFLRASLTEDGKLAIPPEEKIEPLANSIVDEYLSEVCPLPPEQLDSRLLHLFVRLRRLSLIMLREILAELKISRFVPTKFEQIIGMPGEGGLPAVAFDLKNGSRVTLSGKIDRIDFLEENGKTYVRIVDYKSGVHKFSPDEVRSGMDIQLVLYLFSVLASDTEKLSPGGAQYLYAANEKGSVTIGRSGFLLNEEALLLAADGSEDRLYSKKLLLQSAEEIEELTQEMQVAVSSAAERILAGEADKTPSEEACMFCPVRKNCDKAYHK